MDKHHVENKDLGQNQVETTSAHRDRFFRIYEEPLLTTKELARELKVSDRTIQNLVASGALRKIQIGRCVRFLKSEVLSDLEK